MSSLFASENEYADYEMVSFSAMTVLGKYLLLCASPLRPLLETI